MKQFKFKSQIPYPDKFVILRHANKTSRHWQNGPSAITAAY